MPLTDGHNITEVQCKRVVFVHSNLTKYGTFNGAHFLSFCSCGFIKLWNMYIRRALYVLSGSNTRRRTYVPKEWKNEQVWPFFIVVQLIHRLTQEDISCTTMGHLFFFPLLVHTCFSVEVALPWSRLQEVQRGHLDELLPVRPAQTLRAAVPKER